MPAIDQIEAYIRPFYEQKDPMHGLEHVRRILREARTLARSYPEADETLLVLGAYLHGIVWTTDEASIAAFLASQGLAAETIQRAIRAGWESLKEQVPDSIEGKILHDAHLLEGGRTFIVVKSLVVGSARGETLEESIEYIESRVLGRYRCYLPEAQSAYTAKEAFARAFLADLEEHL